MKYLLITLLLFIAYPAVAQESTSDFNSYITKNSAYKSELKAKAEKLFLHTFPQCDREVTYVRLKPSIILAPEFLQKSDPEKHNPNKGQWIESAVTSGCDKSIRTNILTTAYTVTDIPEMYPLINGNTKIEMMSQSLIEKIVHKIILNERNCTSKTIVIDTRFIGYKSEEASKIGPKDQNLGWLEQWIVEACGVTEIINVAALPDPKNRYRYMAKIR